MKYEKVKQARDVSVGVGSDKDNGSEGTRRKKV